VLTSEVRKLLKSITNKRARVVIDHILKHGQITTEDLEKHYGYNHPPRAARDVREAGIPLDSIRVKSSDGRSIVAYKFGDFTKIRGGRLSGRAALPKGLKTELYKAGDGRCYICSGRYEARYLQVDHRVPYEVAGETKRGREAPGNFMLLCGSCNRAKSWSCEHCGNWRGEKKSVVCSRCYWANPLAHVHVALKPVRRADIQWEEGEVAEYDRLRTQSSAASVSIPEFIKRLLRHAMSERPGCT